MMTNKEMMMTAQSTLDVIRACIEANGNPDGKAPGVTGWASDGDRYDGQAVLSPDDWRFKGNHCPDSVVAVVIHEGPGEMSRFFSLDACYRTGAASDYATFEAMAEALSDSGMWVECQNSWSSFVYEVGE